MPATVWSGHITFGLVSFPIELFAAARRNSLDLDLIHRKDGSRVKYVTYCKTEDKPISRDDIVKGFAYEKGKYVILEPDDFAKATPKTAKVMEMQEFIPASQIDPVFLDASYYVSPAEGGQRPYALLYEALRANELWGLAQMAMHSREHTVVLRPGARGLILHTMYYADELRANVEFTVDTDAIQEKELSLATALVKALAADFEPEKYHDTYRQRLESVIEAKRKGKKIVAMPEPKVAPVIDIMDALKRSLSATPKGATAKPASGRKRAKSAASSRRAKAS